MIKDKTRFQKNQTGSSLGIRDTKANTKTTRNPQNKMQQTLMISWFDFVELFPPNNAELPPFYIQWFSMGV